MNIFFIRFTSLIFTLSKYNIIYQTKLFVDGTVLLLFLTSSQVPRLLQNVGSHDPPFLSEPKYDVPFFKEKINALNYFISGWIELLFVLITLWNHVSAGKSAVWLRARANIVAKNSWNALASILTLESVIQTVKCFKKIFLY